MSDEVVQAYFSPVNVTVQRPLPAGSMPLRLQLVDWRRVPSVAPGGAVNVTFALSARQLLLVDADGARVSAPGSYSVRITNGDERQAVDLPLEVVGAYKVVERFPA